MLHRDPNGTDYISDLQDGESRQKSLPEFYSATFSPDGSRFILDPPSHTEGGVLVSAPERIYDSKSARPLTPPWRFVERGKLNQPFSRDGRFHLSIDDAGIWLWDLDQRHELITEFPSIPAKSIIDAATSRDRGTLVILSDDNVLTSYDASSGQPIHPPISLSKPSESDPDGAWKSITLDSAARIVAVVGEVRAPIPNDDRRDVQVVQVWNLQTGRRLFDPLVFDDEHDSWVSSIVFLENTELLLIAEYIHRSNTAVEETPQETNQTRIHLFDLTSGKHAREPMVIDGSISVLDQSVHPPGLIVRRTSNPMGTDRPGVAQSPDTIQIVDPSTWEPVSSDIQPSRGVAWNAKLSPDGRHLAMGDGEVWDIQSGAKRTAAVISHRRVEELVFRDDGKAYLAVTEGGSAYWESPAEMRLFSLDGEPPSPPMLSERTGTPFCAIDPTGAIMAAAGKALRLWDATEGTMLSGAIALHSTDNLHRVENEHRRTFFTPSGNRLYIEAGGRVLLLDWDEFIANLPADELLRAWSEILSGMRIDDSNSWIPMRAEDYQLAWNQIQSDRLKRTPQGSQSSQRGESTLP
jgi:WD40 repeat protein